MKQHLLVSLALIGAVILTSCEKDALPATGIKEGVYVVNQGGFGKNNASLTYFDPASGEVVADIYGETNSGSLGDIAQSVTRIGNSLYIVVNNSGKIVVADYATLRKTGEIAGLVSPRYIAAAGAGKAYVTDLFSNNISVVDLSGNTVGKTIPCKGWTEELLSRDGRTYVANVSSDYLYVLDHATDALSDSILVGKGATSLDIDKNGKLWIAFGALYDSLYNPVEAGKIKCVELTSREVVRSFNMASGSADKLRMMEGGEVFYFLNNQAYRMTIYDTALPATPFFELPGVFSFYTLGLDKRTGDIYLGDAGDYTSAGTVYQVDVTGVEKRSFRAGVIPGEFYMYYD